VCSVDFELVVFVGLRNDTDLETGLTEIYLVRHAQASYGAADYDRLSELGHRQAVWLGEYFLDRGVFFDRLLSGAMRRHEETATGICRGMNRATEDIEIDAGLNEFDFMSLLQTYVADHPEHAISEHPLPREYFKLLRMAMTEWTQGRLDGRVDEDWPAFEARAAGVLDNLARSPRDSKVLVISSGGAMSMMLKHILRCENSTMIDLNLQLSNTGICRMIRGSGRFRLCTFNHAPHLEQAERRSALTFV